jgi:multicomponent Na+:H+ antiporter subunit E
MALLLALLGRFVLFAGGWWLLTGGRTDGVTFGVCCAAAAALTPLIIGEADASPIRRGPLPTVLRLPRLLPFFLWQSLRGGIDVALRAFRPRLPLSPAIIDYRLRLPRGSAPVMLAGLISLMPGTLAIVSGRRLRVHVLDDTREYRHELEHIEALVANVFGLALEETPATGAATGP